MTKAELEARMRELVPKIFAADVELGRRWGIESLPFEQVVGPPASEADIAALERSLGRPLPPSYRTFLATYGRWEGFAGTDLLGVKDHGNPHIKRRCADLSALFDEVKVADPLEAGAIPIGLSDGRNAILLEPPLRDDGEMDVVTYVTTEAQARHSDLLALFEAHHADQLRLLAQPARKPRSEAVKKAPKKVVKKAPKLAVNKATLPKKTRR